MGHKKRRDGSVPRDMLLSVLLRVPEREMPAGGAVHRRRRHNRDKPELVHGLRHMQGEMPAGSDKDKADDADIPADKLLPVSNGATSSAMIPDDLVNTNNDADEIIPF